MREKIGKITLDDTCYSGSDLYSDGPVEEELLEIAKSCHTPEEYNQVIAERKSWPVMYHFSHIRGNIVSWLPITKEDKVLEIGAGCGAITGALAKKAGSVTCVELEFKILALLMRNPGRVFSPEEIYERIWNEKPIGTETIMVHIRNIRTKIEVNPKNPKYLKVVWGVGYKIEKQ